MNNPENSTSIITNSFVWIVPSVKDLTACKPWTKGAVIKVTPPSSHPGSWEFVVDIETVKTVVKTVSVDDYNQEFELVKSRDPEMSISNAKFTNDMTALIFLNEPSIVECLRLRYFKKSIYTSTGPILIAINPCEPINIYGEDIVNLYYSNAISPSVKDNPPHVYEVGDRAYRRMFVDPYDPNMRENQTILVSGESGAGKTVSMRHILHYLAVVSSTVSTEIGSETISSDIESQIMAANPINESFGNARTSRNANSSRFGKFTELRYSADGCIEGAHIKTYLLETVRVPHQTEGERNFHIFYEIFAGLTSRQKAEFGLNGISNFNYLNQSEVFERGDGESDTANFDKLRESWMILDIPPKLQDELLKIVIGILHLGNVEFVRIEAIGQDFIDFHPSCVPNVDFVTKLLGIPKPDLLNALTKRHINVIGSDIAKSLSYSQAIATRDSFAQEIYLRLFNWMMAQINDIISGGRPPEEMSASYIGLLDIFGFEFFEKNSFEQLCINYTNEKLQDHFNFAIFKSEQEVYQQEGLKWVFVDYPDNSARLELLENKTTGIYALCDEQLKMPKCSDEKFAKSLYDKCGKHKYFSASKTEQLKSEFVVKHFACDVKYQADGFLDKNRSDVAKELTDCFSQSKSMMVRQICPVNSSANLTIKKSLKVSGGVAGAVDSAIKRFTLNRKNQPRAVVVRKAAATVSKKFSKDLEELMSKIRSTRSHFIRCVKPNANLRPGVFDERMVIEQLRCGGTLSAVQVFRAGFSHRLEFKKFVSRFMGLWFPCARNLMVVDLLHLVNRAKTTGLSSAWKAAACKVFEIAPIADVMLDAVESHRPVEDVLVPGTTGISASIIKIFQGAEIGRTMVFMKSNLFEHLEGMNNRVRNLLVTKIQRRWRLIKRLRRSGRRSTILVQNTFMAILRFDVTRVIAKRLVNATVSVQRIAMVFICKRRLLRVIRSATLLAAVYRGYRARTMVKRMRKVAAARIQSFYRRYMLQKKFLLLRKFVIQSQRLARRWLFRQASRRASTRIDRGVWAVTALQAAFRGGAVRFRLREFLSGLKLTRRRKPFSKKSLHQGSLYPASGVLDGREKNLSLQTADSPRGASRGVTRKMEEAVVKEMEARLLAEEEENRHVKALQETVAKIKEDRSKEIAALREEIKAVKTATAVHLETATSALAESALFQKESQEAQALIAVLRIENARAKEELVAANALLQHCPKCAESGRLLDEANEKIAFLNNQLLLLRQELADTSNSYETQLSEAKAVESSIRDEEQEARAVVASVQVELDSTKAALVHIQEAEASSRVQLEIARSEVVALSAQVATVGAERDSVRLEASSVKVKLELANLAIAKLTEEIDHVAQERDDVKRDLAVSSLELSSAKEQVEAVKEQKDTTAIELEAVRADASAVVAALADAESALKTAHAETEKTKVELETVRALSVAMEESRARSISDPEKVLEELATLRAEVSVLKASREMETKESAEIIEELRGQIVVYDGEKGAQSASSSVIVATLNDQIICLQGELEEQTVIAAAVGMKYDELKQHRTEVEENHALQLADLQAQLVAMGEEREVYSRESEAVLVGMRAQIRDAGERVTAIDEANELVSSLRRQLEVFEQEKTGEVEEVTQIIATLRAQLEESERQKDVEAEETTEIISSLRAEILAVEESKVAEADEATAIVTALQQQVEELEQRVAMYDSDTKVNDPDTTDIISSLRSQLSDLQQEKDQEASEAEELITSLHEQLSALEDERNAAVSDASLARIELERVKAQAAAVEEDRKVSIEEVEEASEIVEIVRKQLSEMEAERNHARAEAETAKVAIEAILQGEERVTHNVLKAEAQFLSEALADAKNERLRLQSVIDALQGSVEVDQPTKQSEDIADKNLLTTSDESQVLRDQLQASRLELNRLKTSLELENQSTEHLLDEARETMSELRQKLAKVQATNKVLEEDKARQIALLTRANEDASTAKSRLANITQQIEGSTKEVEKYKTEAATAQSRVVLLEQQLEELLESVPQQGQQRAQVTALLGRIQTLDAQRAQAESERMNASDKLDKMTVRLRDAEKDRSRASDSVVAKDKEISTLRTNLLALEQKLAMQAAQLQSNSQTADGLTNKIASLSKKLKAADTDAVAVKRELRELSAQLDVVKKEADTAKTDLASAEIVIQRLQHRLARLSQSCSDETLPVSTELRNSEIELLLSCGGWDPKTHCFNTDIFHYSEMPINSSGNGGLKVLDAVEQVAIMQSELASLTLSLRQSIALKRSGHHKPPNDG